MRVFFVDINLQLCFPGFDVDEINNGSIVLKLRPKEAASWKKLEENCRSGKIKDFIPTVYNNKDVRDQLQDGEYSLKFTIYALPVPPDKNGRFQSMLYQYPLIKMVGSNVCFTSTP